MLKRGYQGVCDHISAKRLERYVAEFAGRHNIREDNTMEQMEAAVTRMVGERIMYKELVRQTSKNEDGRVCRTDLAV